MASNWFVPHIADSRLAIFIEDGGINVVADLMTGPRSDKALPSETFSGEPKWYSNTFSSKTSFCCKYLIKKLQRLFFGISPFELRFIDEITYNCSSARVRATYNTLMVSRSASCFLS